jgi:DNA polymerase-3 subunit gamma/tau
LQSLLNDLKFFDFEKYVFEMGMFKCVNISKLINVENLNTNKKDSNNIKVSERLHTNDKEPEKFDNTDITWQNFLKKIAKNKPALSSNLEHGYIINLNENELVVGFKEDRKWHYDFVNKQNNLEIVNSIAKQFFNNNIVVKFLIDNDDKKKTVIEKKNNIENFFTRKTKKEAMENPIVKKILDEFEGTISEIKVVFDKENQEE